MRLSKINTAIRERLIFLSLNDGLDRNGRLHVWSCVGEPVYTRVRRRISDDVAEGIDGRIDR